MSQDSATTKREEWYQEPRAAGDRHQLCPPPVKGGSNVLMGEYTRTSWWLRQSWRGWDAGALLACCHGQSSQAFLGSTVGQICPVKVCALPSTVFCGEVHSVAMICFSIQRFVSRSSVPNVMVVRAGISRGVSSGKQLSHWGHCCLKGLMSILRDSCQYWGEWVMIQEWAWPSSLYFPDLISTWSSQ